MLAGNSPPSASPFTHLATILLKGFSVPSQAGPMLVRLEGRRRNLLSPLSHAVVVQTPYCLPSLKIFLVTVYDPKVFL